MSLPAPLDPRFTPDREPSESGGASLPRAPAGASHINPELVGRLVGELAAYPDCPVRRFDDHFDRGEAERRLRERSTSAAAVEIAAAKARGVVPEEINVSGPAAVLDLDVRSVMVRGFSHCVDGKPCQDALVVRTHAPSGSLFAVVADGVSGAPLSHHASAIMTDALSKIAEELITDPSGALRENGSFMNARFLGELHHRMCRAYLDVCEQTGLHPRTAGDIFLATTLQLAIVTPEESAIVALGDGMYRWGESYDRIDVATERLDPGFNTPPLLERVIIDEATRQQSGWKHLILRLNPIEANLVKEAEAFHVVAYGPTAQVLPSVVELATDGVQYTDMMPQGEGEYFPLVRLAVTDQRPLEDVVVAAKLFQMFKLHEQHAILEGLAATWNEIQHGGGSTAVTAGLLREFRESAGRLNRIEAEVVLSRCPRSFHGGNEIVEGRSPGTSPPPSQGMPPTSPDGAVGGSLGYFLEERRAYYESVILNLAGEVCDDEARSTGAQCVAAELRRLLDPLLAPNDLVRAELEENRRVFEEAGLGGVLRLLAAESLDILSLRSEVSAGLARIAPEVLRDTFEITPERISVELWDDIAWFVVGARSEPVG